jgi:hypothetical protein
MTEDTYEIKLANGKIVEWPGIDGPTAAARAADCLGVTVVAWRQSQLYVGPVHHSQIIG